MVATSIALAIWTTGLLYLTSRSEKRRLLEACSNDAVEKNSKDEMAGDVKV
jgi:ACS family pantothenate transporter-like MFS transporter